MDHLPDSRWQRLCGYGQPLAVTGVVACGAAMVIGFFIVLWLNFFADPEKPSLIFGKIAAGIFIVFCAGIVVGVLGVFMLLSGKGPSAAKASKPKPMPVTLPDELHKPEPEPAETQDEIVKKSWDEAYNASHRRR